MVNGGRPLFPGSDIDDQLRRIFKYLLNDSIGLLLLLLLLLLLFDDENTSIVALNFSIMNFPFLVYSSILELVLEISCA